LSVTQFQDLKKGWLLIRAQVGGSKMKQVLQSTVFLAVVLILTCAIAWGQSESGTIELMDRGSLTSSSRMSLGFLYGVGSRPDGLGTPVSTVRSGLASVSGNPAGLAYLRANAVIVDVLPSFGTTASGLVDLEGVTSDALDGATEDFTTRGADPAYSMFEAELGQQGGLVSGAVGLRFGQVVVAAALEAPMSVALEMTDTGMEAYGQAVKSEGGEFIDVNVQFMADVAADFAFRMSRTTIAAASDVRPDVALGLSLSRYSARAELSGSVDGDGAVSYGDQEYVFNNPDDPWDNTLGVTSRGAYEGSAFGWSLGASWRPLGFITVDASYTSVPPLKLDGSLKTVSNLMPGITDGEFHLEEILGSQPTLTEREETIENDAVTLLLPSHAGVAVSMHAPFVLATLEYRRFSGSFGFEHGDTAEGVDVTDGLGLELDFGIVRLGGGAIRGKMMGDSLDGGSAGDDVLIPMANVGLGINIGQNVRLDTMVLAVPLQVLRVSLGYEF